MRATKIKALETALQAAKVEIVETRPTMKVDGKKVQDVVVKGHGVSDAFKRHYFKNKQLPKLEAQGIHAELQRAQKGANSVVLRITE